MQQSNLFKPRKAEQVQQDNQALLKKKQIREEIKQAMGQSIDPFTYNLPIQMRNDTERRIKAETAYKIGRLSNTIPKETSKKAFLKNTLDSEGEMLANAIAREKALTMSKKVTMQSEVKFTEYFYPTEASFLNLTYISSNLLWCKAMYALAFLKTEKLARRVAFQANGTWSEDIDSDASYISLTAFDNYLSWLENASVNTIDIRSQFKYEVGKDVVSRCETFLDPKDTRYINNKMVNLLKTSVTLDLKNCTALIFFRHFGKVFQAICMRDNSFLIQEKTEEAAAISLNAGAIDIAGALDQTSAIQFVRRNVQKTFNGFYEFVDQSRADNQFLARNEWKSQNLAKHDSIIVKLRTKSTEFLQNDVYFNRDVQGVSSVMFKLSVPIRYIKADKLRDPTARVPFGDNIVTLKNASNYELIYKLVTGMNDMPKQVITAIGQISEDKFVYQVFLKFLKAIKAFTKAVLSLSRGINTASISRCVKTASVVAALHSKKGLFTSILFPLQQLLVGYADEKILTRLSQDTDLDIINTAAGLFLTKDGDRNDAKKAINEGLKTLIPFIRLTGEMFFDTEYDDMSIQNYSDIFDSVVVNAIREKISNDNSEDIADDNTESMIVEDIDEPKKYVVELHKIDEWVRIANTLSDKGIETNNIALQKHAETIGTLLLYDITRKRPKLVYTTEQLAEARALLEDLDIIDRNGNPTDSAIKPTNADVIKALKAFKSIEPTTARIKLTKKLAKP